MFTPEDGDIISVRLKFHTYTGGAHGSTHYYSWNYSQKKQVFLSLDDIITPLQFKDIVQKVRKKLEKESDSRDQKAHIHRGTSTKEDFKIWNTHKNGIEFVFPEYQVASYAAGNFEIFIPLSTGKAGDEKKRENKQ